ncbi:hypothetical protein CC86DRAFT_366289 [Ophiobolus disseminans]|uniref:DUF6536 domain-containing protein n=1 Tax=Ophiobolus disseminans TaxID=1469910 RepID=A0A6A7AGT3_9PLEO|nr:hypothetical protein CC86DRAFT_366289 [Ophiobolus disseminans]
MFQRALDARRNWFASSRKGRQVYQQRAHASNTELRNLTAASTKSDIGNDIDTEYRPRKGSSGAPSLVSQKKTRVQRLLGDRFTGWRFGILHFAVWATIVFFINLVVTIWGSTQKQSGVLLEGDCNRVKNLNTSLHVLINVLSTILLSGSNYCMQCLSAPTRSEVDTAHAQGKWLDIGIPSIRNVKHLSRQRIQLWILLALTSLPLHLFYNSAVFGSVSSNDYFAFSVSKSFLEDAQCRNCTVPANTTFSDRRSTEDGDGWNDSNTKNIPIVLDALRREYKTGDLDRLDPLECLNQYATAIQSDRRHVLLVASDDKLPKMEENQFINGSRVYWGMPFYTMAASSSMKAANSYDWICSGLNKEGSCSSLVNDIQSNATAWSVRACEYSPYRPCNSEPYPVEYCLSQPADAHCRLQFNTAIAVIVCVLNFVKAAIMFFIVFRVGDEPLITMGDAAASFLETNDPTTKNMCLLSIHDARENGYKAGAREWLDQRYRWKDVTSMKRRTTTLAIFSCALIIVVTLLGWGIQSLPDGTSRSLSGLARLGYGTVDPRTAITGLPNDLVMNAIVANSPQVILSMLYFSYNALFTAFLLSYEWTTYGHKRKGLRLSRRPAGAQRTDYFLQLPYRFGVPLMLLSGTLHWLVSQSIFLVAIDFYDELGKLGSRGYLGYISALETNYKTCGYSPIAMISVVILGVFMVVAIVAFGYVPYKGGTTLAGNCSMAISAACHLDKSVDTDGATAAVSELQWGVIGVSENGVGHCAFSTREVGLPVKGEVYAGTQ